jgi:hypothetical protein
VESRYINTDLDIESYTDLSELGTYLEPIASVLFCGKEMDKWRLCLEAEGSGEGKTTPSEDIGNLIAIVKDAEKKYANLFEAFTRFDFNIGWQSSETYPSGVFTISNEYLKKIVEIGAGITVTVHPPEQDDEFFTKAQKLVSGD